MSNKNNAQQKLSLDYTLIRKKAHSQWNTIYAGKEGHPGLAPELVPMLNAPGEHFNCPHPEKHDERTGSAESAFRFFSDVRRKGGAICSCNKKMGDGFSVLMWHRGWNIHECMQAIANFLNIEPTLTADDLKEERDNARQHATQQTVQVVPAIESHVETASAVEDLGFDQDIPEHLYEVPPIEGAEVPVVEKVQEPAQTVKCINRIRKIAPGLQPIDGTAASTYLKKALGEYLPKPIREAFEYHPSVTPSDGVARPAMSAIIRSPEGFPEGLYLVYLSKRGGLAQMQQPWEITEGMREESYTCGSAVRIGAPGPKVGVCKDIESAIAIHQATGLPMFACLTDEMLASFVPPYCLGIKEVVIFTDRDVAEKGEQGNAEIAARVLSDRLNQAEFKTTFRLPYRKSEITMPTGVKPLNWLSFLKQGGTAALA